MRLVDTANSRALRALSVNGIARVSNVTSIDVTRPTVYWRTAKRLVGDGLATQYRGEDGEYLKLTGDGVHLVASLCEQLTL
ncbi:MAG: hypothetical protein ACYDDZ_11015 [Acidimicrobiales bacterium]